LSCDQEPDAEQTPAAAVHTSIVLLPGLHGTARPFEPFLQECPARYSPLTVSFPRDEPLGYEQLEDYVLPLLPQAERLVLLGESFSGPLAIRLAARRPKGLVAVVLSASFVRSPVPALLRHAPLSFMSRLTAPESLLRFLLAGEERWSHLLPLIRKEVQEIRPHVLEARVRALLSVDVRRELAACPVPLLYLQAKHDHIVPPRCFRDVAATRSDVACCVLDAPHIILQAAPREAWQCIERFLRDQALAPKPRT
jgi:pimeloyl-[acyl-carrier protein] methyl ester esterase